VGLNFGGFAPIAKK